MLFCQFKAIFYVVKFFQFFCCIYLYIYSKCAILEKYFLEEQNMKVTPCKSGNDIIYYLSKGVRRNGKCTTENVRQIGRYSELIKQYEDPLAYCREYAKQETLKEKQKNTETFTITLSYAEQNQDSKVSKKKDLNVGYFYLKSVLDSLNLRSFFRDKTEDKKITFHPLLVTQFLTYARILDPKSKLGSYDSLETYYNLEHFEKQDMYKTLDIISENLNDLQAHLYKESEKIIKRNTQVLYYDCTNFFFDINHEGGLKKYGVSKENRPNPIVQFGLFVDAEGIPLAFNVTPGNTNEQSTTIPLEKQIIRDFGVADFIYVADAGLGCNETRLFNSFNNRDFLVTQSLKKLKNEDLSNILDPNNWYCPTTEQFVNIADLPEDDDEMYFKRMRINNPLDLGIRELTRTNQIKKKSDFYQDLLVCFSKSSQQYQRSVREGQIARAERAIANHTVERTSQNSHKRYIKGGDDNTYVLDREKELYDAQFDGYYAMATSLDADMKIISNIMKRRWQIENSFRVMKTSFKSRPVYHQKDTRIIAHFAICFLALLTFKILEKKLINHYTINNIIKQLQVMTVTPISAGIVHTNYEGSQLLQDLDKAFGKKMSNEAYKYEDLNRQKGNTRIK